MPQGSAAAASPLLSVLHLLHRAGQRADGLFARHAGIALTPRQFIILQAVAEGDGLSQTDIMAATGIDRSSIAAGMNYPIRFARMQPSIFIG